MGNVISIRVLPEIKQEMDRLKGEVNWSEEIREFAGGGEKARS
ncbi:hypothetical protein PYCH_17830 [Pyrococcus yayanosii CH1]|uniref:Uncharacterized protein n=1 Tax=Pyrococcus yayanosii (strain CH1 / JCM 16557) TaxID=529709 RepID=F8AHY5_PYRYC|nr:hypothetical protein PYCH_17830 [Pyrococcus yayanosii CH1]